MAKYHFYRYTGFFGAFLIGISMFIMGPYHLLTRLPMKPWLSIIASFLNGAGTGITFISALHLIIHNLENIFHG
jgi:hypothetical protein